jgi:hypothetical protein
VLQAQFQGIGSSWHAGVDFAIGDVRPVASVQDLDLFAGLLRVLAQIL